jgi:TetR/AcrR family transcriptional repressor of nem operon
MGALVMARPREFEEGEVLDRALHAFWSKGYEGTSVQDLVDETGSAGRACTVRSATRSSSSSGCWRTTSSAQGAEMSTLEDEPSALLALERLFTSWLSVTCPKSGPRGCFLVLSGTSSADREAWARALLEQSMKQTEASLERIVRRGQEVGELKASRDPATVARFLVGAAPGRRDPRRAPGGAATSSNASRARPCWTSLADSGDLARAGLAPTAQPASAETCGPVLPKRRWRREKAVIASSSVAKLKSGQNVFGEEELRVGALEQQEVAEAPLAAGADDRDPDRAALLGREEGAQGLASVISSGITRPARARTAIWRAWRSPCRGGPRS